MAVARDLNLRAKALITDSKLSLSDQIELDRIVLATGTDLLDFKTIRDSAEANKEYMDQFEKSRFELAGDFQTGASVGATDDISWVNDYFTDIEETTDADLAVAATEMVNNLSIEQLQDETVLQISSAFRLEGLAATEEQAEKFVKYVKASVAEKLANYEPVENEESLPDLDDFDTSSLYL